MDCAHARWSGGSHRRCAAASGCGCSDGRGECGWCHSAVLGPSRWSQRVCEAPGHPGEAQGPQGEESQGWHRWRGRGRRWGCPRGRRPRLGGLARRSWREAGCGQEEKSRQGGAQGQAGAVCNAAGGAGGGGGGGARPGCGSSSAGAAARGPEAAATCRKGRRAFKATAGAGSPRRRGRGGGAKRQTAAAVCKGGSRDQGTERQGQSQGRGQGWQSRRAESALGGVAANAGRDRCREGGDRAAAAHRLRCVRQERGVVC
mmetsp:Transcript_27072/g.58974  ORF Transcript_27072/g.58974 Transcript_27072/m.58974 type:complete len:259 (+) Transcript_27072:244-1020(+)